MLQLVCGGPTLAQPWFSSNKIIGGGGGWGWDKITGGGTSSSLRWANPRPAFVPQTLICSVIVEDS